MAEASVGTRVILLQEGSTHSALFAGVVIEERQERYLKRYVIRCDSGAIRYASKAELALESDPQRVPLGTRSAG